MTTLAPFSVLCPSCESEFAIDPGKVPDQGVHAICSGCRRVFHVARPDAGTGQEAGRDDSWQATAEPALGAAAPAPAEVEADAAGAAPDAGAATAELPETDGTADEVPFEQVGSAIAESEPEHTEARSAVEEYAEAEIDLRSQEPEEAAPEPETAVVESELGPQPGPGGSVTVEEGALSRGAARFGRRDPHDRARHLARVLVSDMITYHPALYETAMERGSLKSDFADEVEKSWDEFREQVGEEIADATDYFVRALNEILAGGSDLYQGPGRPS